MILAEAPMFALEAPTALRVYHRFRCLSGAQRKVYLSLTHGFEKIQGDEIQGGEMSRKVGSGNTKRPEKLQWYANTIKERNVGR